MINLDGLIGKRLRFKYAEEGEDTFFSEYEVIGYTVHEDGDEDCTVQLIVFDVKDPTEIDRYTFHLYPSNYCEIVPNLEHETFWGFRE